VDDEQEATERPEEPTRQAPPTDPGIPPMPGQPSVVYHVTQPAMSNGLATAALVCGIVGLVLFWTVWIGIVLGILAVVFGALGRSRAAQGAPNKGQATAGLWLGVAALVGSMLFIGLVASWITEQQQPILDQVERCMENPDAC
jgi:Domain of unknown function (DUF4190)